MQMGVPNHVGLKYIGCAASVGMDGTKGIALIVEQDNGQGDHAHMANEAEAYTQQGKEKDNGKE